MSIEIHTFRAGQEQSQGGSTDQKITDLNTLLVTVLESATQGSVVDEVTKALTDEYGTNSVTSFTAPNDYRWRWDPSRETWFFQCESQTTILVEDGEPTDATVQIATNMPVLANA